MSELTWSSARPEQTFKRDWREAWVDQMGLIVALSGKARFEALQAFKLRMFVELTPQACAELKDCLCQRFTPSNGTNGCKSATEAVASATEP